ncbi:MAG TPA: tRNA 4-thiouridine(8) synthase ThiI [Oceanithermus sp.]|nr:tRNA 4-thiouridine(8) synthase ThiI [Oceanithermus sp.]
MEALTYTALLHYHEVSLKGKNRARFEQILLSRVQEALHGLGLKVSRIPGRILVRGVPEAKRKAVKERLEKVFGLSNFAFALEADPDLDRLAELALRLIPKDAKTFRVSAKRGNKKLPFTSIEAEREVGGRIAAKTGLKVDLKHPELVVFLEFALDRAWVYTDRLRYPGPGGLPVGASGKVMTLLSGGIDSPVAAWRIMKRGAKSAFVHFHSYPHTDFASAVKAKREAEVLAAWQGGARLYLVPLAGVQAEIFAKSPEKYRTLLYRRFMFRIAHRLAEREGAGALVTGDALGQVASQTLENLHAVSKAVDALVLRPLVGMDKVEVIEEAKRIGTYEISILPQQDCCSFLEPRRPATRATPEELDEAERDLRVEDLVEAALGKAELLKLPSPYKGEPLPDPEPPEEA